MKKLALTVVLAALVLDSDARFAAGHGLDLARRAPIHLSSCRMPSPLSFRGLFAEKFLKE